MRQLLNSVALALVTGFCSVAAHADNFTVSNGNDSGPGSLRAAIEAANEDLVPWQHDILFEREGLDIVLTSPLPVVKGHLQIGIYLDQSKWRVSLKRDPAAVPFRLLELASTATVSMKDLDLSGGSSNGNGGLISNAGTLGLRNCSLSGGSAGQGGAIFSANKSHLSLAGCTFKNNAAPLGGAIYNVGEFTAFDSTFAGNSAQLGGAIEGNYSNAQGGDYSRFYRCTFSGNSASQNGGAIHSVNQTLTLESCTVVGNSAPAGAAAGVATEAPVTPYAPLIQIKNSILAGNAPAGGEASGIDVSQGDAARVLFQSLGHNLVGSSVGTPMAFTSAGDLVGYTRSNIGVGELGEYGGPTPTMPLLPGSPALDAGSTEDATDQRGAGRNQGSAPDIGAFEGTVGGNIPPVAEGGGVACRVGKFLSYQLRASDLDGDKLTYLVLDTLPDGLTYDSTSGLVYGTPTQTNSLATIRYQVSDGQSTSNIGVTGFNVVEPQSSVVNTTGEADWFDNKTSLSEAIDFVWESGGNIPITFDLPVGDREIVLTQPLAPLAVNMSITGPTTGGGVTIRRSSAQGTPKFPIFRVQGSYVTLRNLTIQGGDAGDGKGGGVSNLNGGLIMERCTLVGNSAQEGGGIYGLMQEYGTYTCLLSCTVTGNVAQQGGGLAVGIGVFVIDSSTIVGNRAASGAGAGVWALPNHITKGRVSNSIIAGNLTNGEGSVGNADVVTEFPPGVSSAFESWGGNVIGDGNAANYFKAARDIVGVTDAELGVEPLAQNGGFTPTMALRSSSPAVNRSSNHEEFDQRNFPRVSGEFADSGAYELLFNDSLKVTSLTLTPEAPRFGSTLQAEAKVASSSEPYQLVYTWTRTRDGKTLKLDVAGATLDSSKFDIRQGDLITVTAVASQGLYDSPPASASVTIANTPIAISELRLQPRAPYVSETMIATVKIADIDKPRPTYSYVWKRNGIVTRTLTDSRNSQDFYDLRQKGRGAKGDVIEVTVTASDSESTATATASATIRNSIPVVESLTLSPQAPTATSTVVSTYGGRDADGDKLTRTYKWRIGTKLLKDESGSRLDLRKYPFVKPGDIVSLDLQLFDGEAYSKTITAKATVAAAGTAPALAPASGSAASS